MKRIHESLSIEEEMFEKAIGIVEENIPNELFGIPQFSESLNVSRGTLLYKIKAWTGMSPMEWVRSMRLKKAAMLLRRGSYRISEISVHVGFRSPYYFSKCFKKFYGISPREYARRFEQDSF